MKKQFKLIYTIEHDYNLQQQAEYINYNNLSEEFNTFLEENIIPKYKNIFSDVKFKINDVSTDWNNNNNNNNNNNIYCEIEVINLNQEQEFEALIKSINHEYFCYSFDLYADVSNYYAVHYQIAYFLNIIKF